jgi:molybdopterin-guanine dinucleotide biosynthesis protein
MAIYIGITGTHSTGKSTFVEQLRQLADQRGIRTVSISDKATDCRKRGFPILKDHSFESTLWIMVTVIQQELEEGLNADLVIVDRPVSDAIGYLEAALASTDRSVSNEEREYLYALAKNHSSRYALLFKTKLDESIPLGPERDPDLDFRREVDQQIGLVLEQLGLLSLDPLSDQATERIAKVLDAVAMM